jgi:hypothetical protein
VLAKSVVPFGADVVTGKVAAGKPVKAKMIAGGLCDPNVSDRSYIAFHGGLKLGLQGCKQSVVVINLGKSGCSDSECGQSGASAMSSVSFMFEMKLEYDIRVF